MNTLKRGLVLVSAIIAILTARSAHAQVPTITIADTIYYANGTPAQGTVIVSWNAFTTANGVAIAAGNTTVTLGSGGSLTVTLAPNAGATPMANYYTAVYHLDDGETTREFWVVPVAVPGGGPAKLAGIRNQVLPTSVAMQTVSKQYVDAAISAAISAAQAAPLHATAGTIDGVTIGATTPAAGTFTTLKGTTSCTGDANCTTGITFSAVAAGLTAPAINSPSMSSRSGAVSFVASTFTSGAMFNVVFTTPTATPPLNCIVVSQFGPVSSGFSAQNGSISTGGFTVYSQFSLAGAGIMVLSWHCDY